MFGAPTRLCKRVVSKFGLNESRVPAGRKRVDPWTVLPTLTPMPIPATDHAHVLSNSCDLVSPSMSMPITDHASVGLATKPSIPNSTRMVTRAQTHSLKLKQFPQFQLYYSTKQPLVALSSVSLPLEPHTYKQAVSNPHWKSAMQAEFDALIAMILGLSVHDLLIIELLETNGSSNSSKNSMAPLTSIKHGW